MSKGAFDGVRQKRGAAAAVAVWFGDQRPAAFTGEPHDAVDIALTQAVACDDDAAFAAFELTQELDR